MKVLILGAQGNLGTQLVSLFWDENVVGLDRQDLDFLNFDLLESRLNLEKADVIINAVAYNAVDKCESEKEERVLAYKLNSDLPGFLANFCLINKKILIHYSTDYVFSSKNKEDFFIESDTPEPINIYGITKAEGESKILSLESKGLNFYLIRSARLFGPPGSSSFSKPSFFDLIISLAQNRDEIKAVDDEYGCFSYTPDLAAETIRFLREKAPFGIYHLINEGVATWHDGAQEALKIKGINISLIPVLGSIFPRPAKRPVSSVLKNTKRPLLRNWKEALADYLK